MLLAAVAASQLPCRDPVSLKVTDLAWLHIAVRKCITTLNIVLGRAQVEALGYAIAGERVPIDLVISAPSGASDVSLSVTASYREAAGQPPELALDEGFTTAAEDVIAESASPSGDAAAESATEMTSAPRGTAHVGRDAEAAASAGQAQHLDPRSGAIEGVAVAKEMAGGSSKRLRAWMLVPSRGQIQISAQLSSRTQEVHHPTMQQTLHLHLTHAVVVFEFRLYAFSFDFPPTMLCSEDRVPAFMKPTCGIPTK